MLPTDDENSDPLQEGYPSARAQLRIKWKYDRTRILILFWVAWVTFLRISRPGWRRR
jgi:hypothetical protein